MSPQVVCDIRLTFDLGAITLTYIWFILTVLENILLCRLHHKNSTLFIIFLHYNKEGDKLHPVTTVHFIIVDKRKFKICH